MAIPAPLAFPPTSLRNVSAGRVVGNPVGSSGTRAKSLTSAELKAIVEASGISYLPLSGGTLTGALAGTSIALAQGSLQSGGLSFGGFGGANIYGRGQHFVFGTANTNALEISYDYTRVARESWIGWSDGSFDATNNNVRVSLYSDAAGTVSQRNGLNAQCYDLFETYTSSTNNGKLRFKATSAGHQIGSARASSGSNRTVNLGHFDASDVFTAALKIGTDGHVMFPTGLYDNANQLQMAFGGGFIQVDQNLYVQQPIFHAARSTITVDNNYGSIWVASTSGTKDGVTYGVGDVLITTVTSSVSKTVLLVDYSAI